MVSSLKVRVENVIEEQKQIAIESDPVRLGYLLQGRQFPIVDGQRGSFQKQQGSSVEFG